MDEPVATYAANVKLSISPPSKLGLASALETTQQEGAGTASPEVPLNLPSRFSAHLELQKSQPLPTFGVPTAPSSMQPYMLQQIHTAGECTHGQMCRHAQGLGAFS